MKITKYLLLLGMILGMQLNAASEYMTNDDTDSKSWKEATGWEKSAPLDQSEEGQIQFIKDLVTKAIGYCSKSTKKAFIKKIVFNSTLQQTDGQSFRSGRDNSSIYTYNPKGTTKTTFKQDVDSIVECFKHYKKLDKLDPSDTNSPTLHLKNFEITCEYHTAKKRIETTMNLDFFEKTVLVKKFHYHKCYFNETNLALLALATCATAATMYYTKTSPKDLITKLWSLAGATRRMFNKK